MMHRALHATHDPGLVALSFVVACLASYAALQLSGRVVIARDRARLWWLGGSALTMGVGIWSMHFIAMLAFRIGLPIAYAVDVVVLSVVVAIAASLLAFITVSRPGRGLSRLLIASLFMGPAIAGMHYIGMAAVRLPAHISYDPWLLTLSVVIAISASFAALRLSVAFGQIDVGHPAWAKPASAVLMGLAICGMHYTGMMAARFTAIEMAPPTGPFIIASDGLAYAVGVSATFIAGIALAAVLLDRSFRAKLAEAATIRQSEERIRLLLEGVRDYAIFSLDPHGRVAQWNAGAERMTGYMADEITGRPIAVLQPEAAAGNADRELRDALANGRAESQDWHVRKDGSRFLAHVVTNPMYNSAGTHVGFSKLIRDVTERWRADEALRESQERLQFALTAARMTTWELDLDTETVFRSGDARLSTGIPGKTATERVDDFLARVHPDDRAPFHRAVRRARANGRFEVDFRLTMEDGTTRWINATGRRSTEPGQPGNRIVGLSTDITERRQLEEQFRQAQKMEAVGQLAGGIAHDFNNLLTVIRGNSELLLDVITTADARHDALSEILAASDRAASLTSQLLAFSRRQLMRPRALDLNAVITELEPMLRRLIGEDIAISTHLEPSTAAVLADRGQLEQILMNLAVNARDAMPRGGTLSIETANVTVERSDDERGFDVEHGPYVMVSVIDTGIGIDPAIQPRVFEPFFTTKEPSRGTGLGLSTVYGIVKQSGGYIRIESELGRGTAVRMYLKRAAVGAPEPAVARSTPPDAPAGSETILLVEDEDMVRRLARQILERQGYQLLEATDGVHALEVADRYRGRIHALVTDVVMPKMGGRELAEQLLRRRPEVKVLFISGYTDDDIIRRGLLTPSMAFLQKPFSAEELAAAVRKELTREVKVD